MSHRITSPQLKSTIARRIERVLASMLRQSPTRSCAAQEEACARTAPFFAALTTFADGLAGAGGREGEAAWAASGAAASSATATTREERSVLIRAWSPPARP